MQITKGSETLPFSEVIRPIGRQRMQEALDAAQRNYSYIERGLYAEQLERLFSLFPKSQCLFLRTDQMWNDRESCMARIADFLGIAPFPPASRSTEYVVPREDTRELGRPEPADLTYMMTLFRQDIARTASLTGLDLSDWLDPAYSEPMAIELTDPSCRS